MPMEYYVLTVGIILLLIELLIPGFGIFGIAGTLCLSWSGYYLLGGGVTAILAIIGFYVLLAVGIAFLSRNTFAFWDKNNNGQSYGGSDLSALVGQEGVTLTTLRPAGTVLVKDKRLDVSSLGDYIPKDVAVRIVKTEGSKIFVDMVRE